MVVRKVLVVWSWWVETFLRSVGGAAGAGGGGGGGGTGGACLGMGGCAAAKLHCAVG